MANEKRLIDANALIEKMENTSSDVCADYGDGFCQHGYSTQLFRLMVSESPTVDAVEVVHGRCAWCNGDYHTKIMATAIRYHSNGNMDGYEMKVNYCPNCGAKKENDYVDSIW